MGRGTESPIETMRNLLSIKWRLALQFTLVVFFVLLVAGTSVVVLFGNKARGDVDTLLYLQYASLKTALPISINDISRPDWKEEMFRSMNAVQSLGFRVIITDSSGNVFEHSSTTNGPLPRRVGYSTVEHNGRSERLFRGVYGPYVIVLGRDLTSTLRDQQILLSVLFLALIGTLLLSASLSAMFAGRALSPLRRFSKQVQSIDPVHVPTSSLASQYPDDEIGRLARIFDDFLHRLDRAFMRERQFTQDASHELRTPLMVIRSSLDLLLSDPRGLTDAQQAKIALIQGAVGRMETLVTELLELSRGHQASKKEDIMLGAFIRDLSQTYALMAEKKGLSFSVKVRRDARIRARKSALEKVIGNLLKNAIRFTATGGVSVEVDAGSVTVSDTGVGIDRKDIGHIFERFYRSDRSRHTEGTGLGLAICKEMCDAEGWKISVTSEVGKGSVFTLAV